MRLHLSAWLGRWTKVPVRLWGKLTEWYDAVCAVRDDFWARRQRDRRRPRRVVLAVEGLEVRLTPNAVVAYQDSYTTLHDQLLVVNAGGSPGGLLENDTDADGDPLTVSAVNGAAGNLGQWITTAQGGSLVVGPDGSLEYQPKAGFVGSDSFSYVATDGAESDGANVTINVTDQAPVAHGDSYTVLHDQLLVVNAGGSPGGLLENDTDADGDPLTVSAVNGAAGNLGQWITTAQGGSLVVGSDGSLEYQPKAGWVGSDSVSYVASDGAESDGAVVTIDVLGPATPTVVVTAPASGTYNGNPFVAEGTVNGGSTLEGVGLTFDYQQQVGGSWLDLGGSAPSAPGSYQVTASYAGNSPDYTSAQSQPAPFTISQATPTVTVNDASGTFNGSPFSATATVAGVVSGVDDTPASTLEGEGITLDYEELDGNGNVVGDLGSTPPVTGGSYLVTASFAGSTDYTSASAETTFTILQVTIADPGVQFDGLGDTVSLQISGSDSAGNPLLFSAVGLPPGLKITNGGLIYGTILPTASTDTPYAVTAIATDETNGAATANWTFYWVATDVAYIDPIPDQTNVVGDTVSFTVPADYASFGPVSFGAIGLPTGLSIDSTTGVISGTISSGADANSPYSVTVTATENGISSSQSFLWAVGVLGLTSPGNQSNVVGDEVDLGINADNATGNPLTFSATGLPPGLSIDPDTGVITGSLAAEADSASPYTVVVTVSAGSQSTSQAFNWQVSVISLDNPGDQINYDGQSVSLAPTVHYNGTGNLTFSEPGLPDGLTFNTTTGAISGTVANTADLISPFSVTITVTDGINYASQSFNWNISPTLVFPETPAEVDNQVGDTVSLQVPAFDVFGSSISYSATGLPPGLSIDSSTGTITGTIAPGANTTSPYTVTVMASVGGLITTAPLSWVVAQAGSGTGSGESWEDVFGPAFTTPAPRRSYLPNYQWHNDVTNTTWSLSIGTPEGAILGRQGPVTSAQFVISGEDAGTILINMLEHPNQPQHYFDGVTFFRIGFSW